MSRVHSVLALACVLALPLALGGCAGVLLAGGLGAAAGGTSTRSGATAIRRISIVNSARTCVDGSVDHTASVLFGSAGVQQIHERF